MCGETLFLRVGLLLLESGLGDELRVELSVEPSHFTRWPIYCQIKLISGLIVVKRKQDRTLCVCEHFWSS